MKIGQPYNLGMWKVEPEQIPAFIEAWQASVEWISENLAADGEAVLLQDTDNPGKFISFAYSSDPEKAQEVMSQTEFQEHWSRVQALSEQVEPHRMLVAAYSAHQPDD